MAARPINAYNASAKIEASWIRFASRLGPDERTSRPPIEFVLMVTWTTSARSNGVSRPPSPGRLHSKHSRCTRRTPETFDVHIKLMFDLLAIAYKSEITRVAT
jgi:hypothetical protein